MKNFDYYLPSTEAEALEVLKKEKGARLKAGGTDLLPLLKHHLTAPSAIVNLRNVKDLSGIRTTSSGALWIGATTTLDVVAEHPDFKRVATAVAEAAAQTATPLVRSTATVGGNLCQRPRCWYFRHPDYACSKKGGDTCFAAEGENKYHAIFENVTCNIVHPSNLAPALWAMDAVVHVTGGKGKAEIPIADFWVLPEEDIRTEIIIDSDQLIVGVSFKPTGPGSGSWYMEAREKQSYDWALTACAARLDMSGGTVQDARIIAAAVAPVPLRRMEAEAVLKGKAFTEELAWKAADAALSGATPLRDNGYKVRLLRSTVAHTLMEAANRAKGAK
jgi:xanthine dehydrogenase YagS FAD-binding subunit